MNGTGVALATPLKADLSVDYPALRRLITHTKEGGVEYFVVLGTTGESPAFEWEEKLSILDFVLSHAEETDVVMGLGGNHTLRMRNQLKDLNNRPIKAILSASPYYNKPSQEGIQRHYAQLADQSHSPLILYNVPHRTASNMDAETTLALAEHENIIGIKEASGDIHQCSVIVRDKPDNFLLISGDDLLTLPIISVGGSGVISVLANAYPRPFSEMVRKALSGEFLHAKQLHAQLLKAMDLAGAEGNPTSIKAALKALSICEPFVKPPLMPPSKELIATFSRLEI